MIAKYYSEYVLMFSWYVSHVDNISFHLACKGYKVTEKHSLLFVFGRV